MDTDKDGKISKQEARGPMKERFSIMDANDDGYISEEEMRQRMRR